MLPTACEIPGERSDAVLKVSRKQSAAVIGSA